MPETKQQQRFNLDEAYKLLTKGKRITLASVLTPEGKAPWWIEKFKAGKSDILLQVTAHSVGVYSALHADFSKEFVEVTEDMI